MSEPMTAQCHVFLGTDYEGRKLPRLISYRREATGVVENMFHVILFESNFTTMKRGERPQMTMNVVCKLLDAEYYAKQLSESIANVIGFIFNKHDDSLKHEAEIMENLNTFMDDIWPQKANNDTKSLN